MPNTLHIIIAPEGGDRVSWKSFVRKMGGDYVQWDVDKDGTLEKGDTWIAEGSINNVCIIAHGGNTDHFLHMDNDPSKTSLVASTLKTELTSVCALGCRIRVQICSAGSHPSPPFIEMVTPASLTATSPKTLSYIDRDTFDWCDFYTPVTVKQLKGLRTLLTASAVDKSYGDLFQTLFGTQAIRNVLQGSTGPTVLNEIKDIKTTVQTNAFFADFPYLDKYETDFGKPKYTRAASSKRGTTSYKFAAKPGTRNQMDLNKFAAIDAGRRFRLLKALHGQNTVTYTGK